MKIAMIGQKGLPATYGGIERHVEELGARLAALGHEVTVFTRPNYSDSKMREYRGMRLKSLPTIGTKHLDAIGHSLLSTFACWVGDYDVIHYHAIGPCLASPFARMRGRSVVATIHGQDWRRGKWGKLASNILRFGEWMALRIPNATISVSESLAKMYREQKGRSVVYVPNGIKIDTGDDISILEEYGLEDGGYLLFAGRLVPEKGAHHLLESHARMEPRLPLVIAGGSSNSDEYVASMRDGASNDVVFTGYQYGARLAALFRHAALFVLPSDLEGLPIVLLEALAYGVPVLASDIPPNLEVLGEKGEYFKAGDTTDLVRALEGCLGKMSEIRSRTALLREEALREYDWGRIVRQVEGVYQRIVGSSESA